MTPPDAKDPKLAKAELDKARADAASAKLKLEREQMAALIPDFKDVERGSFENKADRPMMSSALAHRAAREAAEEVADKVSDVFRKGGGRTRLLVTSDAELAGSDAAYHDVAQALNQLTTAAEALLNAPDTPEGAAVAKSFEALGFSPLIPAIIAQIPALLGVFSARRSLTSAAADKNDLAATAAVMHALREEDTPPDAIVHDGFRMVPTNGILERHALLVALRRDLTELKLRLEDEKATASDPDGAAMAPVRVRLAMINSVGGAIDEFNKTALAVPAEGTRSPLTSAALRQQLHGSEPPFTHVLLVKSEGGDVHQSIDDKAFFMKDKVSIVASASITWMLMTVQDGAIAASGTGTGTVSAHGNIGNRLELTIAAEH